MYLGMLFNRLNTLEIAFHFSPVLNTSVYETGWMIGEDSRIYVCEQGPVA